MGSAVNVLQPVFAPGETARHQIFVPGNSLSNILITDQRCILWKTDGTRIVEFPRDRLASMDYAKESLVGMAWLLFIAGAVLLLLMVGGSLGEDDQILVGLAGAISIAVGFMFLCEVQKLQFWVMGRTLPIVLKQTRYLWKPLDETLISLLRQIRATI